MRINRYSIYLVNLDPTIGSEISKTRPAIVVSDDRMNCNLSTVVVCPLTTSLHPTWRSRVQLMCSGRQAEIAVDQIRCISKARLVKHVDDASDPVAEELRRVIYQMYAE